MITLKSTPEFVRDYGSIKIQKIKDLRNVFTPNMPLKVALQAIDSLLGGFDVTIEQNETPEVREHLAKFGFVIGSELKDKTRDALILAIEQGSLEAARSLLDALTDLS